MQRYAEHIELPTRIARLAELSVDLWWTWHRDARELFRQLDYTLWRATAHNPVRMLWTVPAERLRAAATSPEFLALYDRTVAAYDAARDPGETWWARHVPSPATGAIAYFSAEFALHQSIPIYAGGLGVLAGDHCKSADDLGVPLVGVGFMYPEGYFHQSLAADGWQEEHYEHLKWADAPIARAVAADGRPCTTAVQLEQRTVQVAVWCVRIGRVRLYLLDTNVEGNTPGDRALSARLYGGDRDTRIQQEIVLGVGGVRALGALGIAPMLCHLNEGHAAFVVLERLQGLMGHGASFDDALDQVRRTTVFTTHTPVPAGHDVFTFDMVERYLGYCWGTLGPHRDRLFALGAHDAGHGAQFNMTALALRGSGAVNAVSQLHASVTRRMWDIWPGVAEAERPVRAVTNGVHLPTWLAADLSDLLDRYLAPDWLSRHDDPAVWEAVLSIPDESLWQVRRRLRRYLFAFLRERARQEWTNEHVGLPRVVAAGTLLDPEALTIGFARRFAAYKRPDLVFRDPDRLAAILNDVERPVQIIFAGKAHPADEVGKRQLQQVYAHTIDPRYAGRVAFVDDYDLHVAHLLVQGCDVWMNTPRKPLEASGTSGMKAAINGVPHLSIGDGWWAEGYNGSNGWLIDGGVSSEDTDRVDAADADALYRLLEERVVPAFYERDASQLPRAWLATIKESIRTTAPRFSAERMVKEYAERMYAPSVPTPSR
jgi:starch phosphorylase